MNVQFYSSVNRQNLNALLLIVFLFPGLAFASSSSFFNVDLDLVPHLLDPDDDDDGVLDVVEHPGLADPMIDSDNDGLENYRDADAAGFVDVNGDGVDDRYDFDGDGIINSLDLDSDNDGIYDLVEAGGIDADNDGQLDNFGDHDGDGLGNAVDVDCDGAPLFANALLFSQGLVTLTANMLDGNTTTFGALEEINAFVDVVLPQVVPKGTLISLTLSSADGSTVTGNIRQALDTSSFINTQSFSFGGVAAQVILFTTTTSAKHLRITRLNSGSALRVHAALYNNCNGLVGAPLTVPNSDGDAQADFLDLDSDNDGCFDVFEAGYSDDDADGVAGVAPLQVSASGIVIGSGPILAYQGTDANVVSPGTGISLNLDPISQSILEGDDVSFTVGTAGTNATFKWQISPDGVSFSDLAEGGFNPQVTGATTASLTLENVPFALNGHFIRAILGRSTHPCSSDTSLAVTLTVSESADLKIIQTISDDRPNVGDTVDLLYIAKNFGPSTSTSTQVSLTVPANLNVLTANATLGTYDVPSGVWTLGTLSASALDSLQIEAKVLSLNPGLLSGTIASAQVDPNLTNNTDSVNVNPELLIDLDLALSINDTTPTIGTNALVYLTLSNLGSQDASNLVIDYAIPSGYTWVASNPSVGTYDEVNGQWTLLSLAAGAVEVLELTLGVNPSGVYLLNASGDADEDDAVLANNLADLTVTPLGLADLQVSLGALDLTPAIDGPVEITVTVLNLGASFATGNEVQFSLPSGFDFISADPNDGSYDPLTGIWAMPNLNDGETSILTVNATALGVGVHDLTVGLNSAVNDNDLSNNADTLVLNPQLETDLEVSTNFLYASLPVGANATLFVEVVNNGPSAASGVQVSVPLPSGFTFVSDNGSYDEVSGIWTIGNLNSGVNTSLTIEATVLANGIFLVNANVSGNETDPQAGNNSSSASLTPLGVADVSVSLSLSDPNPVLGGNVDLTVTVSNAGSSDATGLVLSNIFGAGYTYVSNTPAVGTYDDVAHQWTIGNLASGANVSLVINLDVELVGSLSLSASVFGNENDPDVSNNLQVLNPNSSEDADLGINLNVNDIAPNAGDTVTFFLTASNNGGSIATGVQVLSVLPSGYAFVSWSSAQGIYNSASGLWSVGNIQPGNNVVLQIRALVLGAGTFTNTATISGDQSDSNGANDTAVVNVNPNARVDLLALLTYPNQFIIGDTVTLQVSVVNPGPSAAAGVDFSAVIPSGFTFESSVPSQGSFNGGSGLWTIGAMAIGATVTLDLNLIVEDAGSYEFAGSASSTTIELNLTDNDVAYTAIPSVQTDLQIALTASDLTPLVGASSTLQLSVTNGGPSEATMVEVTSQLPAGLIYNSDIASLGTYDPLTGIWTIGNIAANQTVTLDITVDINASGSYTQISSVAGNEFDANVLNNASEITLIPDAQIDLAVTVSVSDTTPKVGSSVVFTINASNAGPSQATGVSLSNFLPVGYDLTDFSVTIGTYDSTSSVWTIGTLNNGTAATIALTADVLGTGSLVKSATITGNETDTDASNNSASVTTNPIPQADLSIVSVISNPNPSIGTNVTFTLTASNNGPSDATAVIVNDLLPIGYTFISAIPTQGTYNSGSGVWNLGSLANGVSRTMTITATLNNNDDYENTATIAGAEADPVSGNDISTNNPIPVPRANLMVFQSVDNFVPPVGTNITFTIFVNNTGPSNASGVVVADPLPAGYTFVNATASAGSYDPVTGDWTIGYLNNGILESLTLTAKVQPSGSYANTAVVSGDQIDQTPANNTSNLTPFPIPQADLLLSTSTLDLTPFVGQTVTIEVHALNLIGSSATSSTASFPIPSGFTFVSKTPSAGTYDEGTGLWNIGSLATGASELLVLELTVNPTGVYSWSGSLSSAISEADASNNTTSLTFVPVNQIDLEVTGSLSNPAPPVTSTISFEVIVTNNGSSTANNIELTDLLPSGYAFSSAVVTNGSYNSVNGVWDLSVLLAGDSDTLTLSGVVQAAGNYSNQAVVVADEAESDSSNNAITLTPTVGNIAPTAGNDSETIAEEGTAIVNLILNDSDLDGLIIASTIDLDLSAVGVQNSLTTSAGSWSVTPLGILTFTPNQNVTGVVKIPYIILDDDGASSNVAEIEITITPVNDPPTIINSLFAVDEELTLSDNFISLTESDNESVLVANTTPVAGPLNGSITIYPNGNFVYDPNLNFSGTDTVVVSVCDQGVPTPAECVNDTLFITVNPINDAPVAVDEVDVVNEDVSITVDIASNDTDVDGTVDLTTIDFDKFTPGIQSNITTAQGFWLSNGDGTVTFTPNGNFNGEALLTYTINDNSGATSNIATLLVTVTAINDPLTIDQDNVITDEDEIVFGDVTNAGDTDIDGNLITTVAPVKTPSNGTLLVTADGSFSYTPDLNFNGLDTAVVEVCDDGTPLPATCAMDTIFIEVTPVNDTPVAINDSVSTTEGVSINIAVNANDFDIDGTINISSVDLNPVLVGQQASLETAEGSWMVLFDGSVDFIPAINFCGQAQISYFIEDNDGSISNVGNIVVEVTCVNSPLSLDNEVLTTNEDTPISADVTDIGDIDADGNLLVNTTPVVAASNGVVSMNVDGTFAYTPNANYVGTDLAVYEVCDDGTPLPATCANDTIRLLVLPVNDFPVAVNDSTTGTEDNLVTLNLTANDSDIDGLINVSTVDLNLSLAGIQNFISNADGTWSVDASGNLSFDPQQDLNGQVTLSYTVMDTTALVSNAATIVINLSAVNDAPVLVNEYFATDEEVVLNADALTATDVDVDGNLSVSSTLSAPNNGSFSINADGTFTYTPNADFVGLDTAIVEICDDGTPLPALCSQDTIIIVVNPISDLPLAENDSVVINEDTQAAIDVSANDTDPDGAIISSSVDLDPSTAGTQIQILVAEGLWSVDANGIVTFTPVMNFVGSVQTTYQIRDDAGTASNNAVIYVEVLPVNDEPISAVNRDTTNEDTPLAGTSLSVGDSDIDGNLVYTTTPLSGPSNGNVTLASDGSFTYSPNADFNGIDTMILELCDDGTPLPKACVNDTMIIHVLPVNDLPTATTDYNSTDEDVPVSTSVTANDLDGDGHILLSSLDLDPGTVGQQTSLSNAEGTWTANAYGSIDFVPAVNWNGLAIIQYQVRDNLGALSNIVNLEVTVNPINDAPVTVSTSVTTDEDTPVSGDMLTATDTDVDGVLSVSGTAIENASHGQFTWASDGTFTYTPYADYNGIDRVILSVCDDGAPTPSLCTNDTVFITVNPITDAPIAMDDITSSLEDNPATVNVLANDDDPDGNLIPGTVDLDQGTPGIQSSISTADGSWSVSAAGLVTFTPNANYCGITSISYTATDNDAVLTNVANIEVHVLCVNDQVVADNEYETTIQNGSVNGDITDAGDSDVDGNLVYSTAPLSGPSNGFIHMQANGEYVYSPKFGFNGSDTIVYSICDDGTPLPATCTTDTIFITVAPAIPPVAENDSIFTNEDFNASLNVLANDSDADGFLFTNTVDLDPLTPGIQNTYNGAEGNVSVDSIGGLNFVPTLNYCGTFDLDYTVQDNDGLTSNIAVLHFDVTCINDVPELDNEFITMNEDDVSIGDFTDAGDTDVEGVLSVNTVPVYGPNNGTLVYAADGAFTYTPNPDFYGADTAIVEVCDDGFPLPIACSMDTLFVTISPINDAPIIDNEYHTTAMNVSVSGDLTDAGDSDVDGNLFATIVPVYGPSNGTVNVAADGTYSYTPNANFFGEDTIVVEICDDGTPLPSICINDTIFVSVYSTFPIAVNDSATVNEDTQLIIVNLLANDSDVDGTLDPTTIDIDQATPGIQSTLSAPEGNYSVDPAGAMTYDPAQDYYGPAGFDYTVQDDSGFVSNLAQVYIDVLPINDTPDIANEYFYVPEEGTLIETMLDANDTDVDGNLSINQTPVYGPNNGSFTISPSGAFVYEPNIGFFGNDTVIIEVCDDGFPLPSICVNDTIFIVVTPINHPPTQGNEYLVTVQNVSLTNVDILANNIDPTNDPLSVAAPTNSQQGGLVIINPDKTMYYTPAVDFIGQDMVPYTVCDTAVVPNCVFDTAFIMVLSDNDGDGVGDIIDLDDDNDGILDSIECIGGGLCDSDGDGIADSLDLDSDNDGFADLYESKGTNLDNDFDGRIDSPIDVNQDGFADIVDPLLGGIPVVLNDEDGDGIRDFQDVDVDNDGISDRNESGEADLDNNGQVDVFVDANNDGWTDDLATTLSADVDGDQIDDRFDLDSDNDGISDAMESSFIDLDNNGQVDDLSDANKNGMADVREGKFPADTDGDGIMNHIDKDSDNDGLSDILENGSYDDDNDGQIDNVTDLNFNGWPDSKEGVPVVDIDGEGVYDFVDLDSDQDAIPDVIEAGYADDNYDGIIDQFTDANNDGWNDATPGVKPSDFDEDGLPDHWDMDSDNDTHYDVKEGGFLDENFDGIIDGFVDANGDGWFDDALGNVVPDFDGDNQQDFRDVDSDNDGMSDLDEAGVDCDEDGHEDVLDTDPCYSGIDIPEAITPNGDGINDVLIIKNIERFPGNNLKIFNRWGNQVYEANDYDNTWDGSSKSSLNFLGDDLPTGTYYYVFDTKTEEFGVVTGYIYLQR